MPLWTPARIASSLWIDFSDTATLFDATSGGSNVTNGVGIARAEDKSGNGRHFTQSTAGARPTYNSSAQNGLGIGRYDGGDFLTSISARSVWRFLHNAQSTLFFVVKNGTSANPSALLGWLGNNGNTSNNIGVVYGYDDRGILTGFEDAFSSLCAAGGGNSSFGSVNFAGNAIVTEFRNVITPNAFGVFTVRTDPTNATPASRIKLAVNGGGLVGNNDRSAGVSASDSTFDLQIGTQGNNATPFLGDYCELLIFDSLLSTTNQQLIEGYLAWKWGLQGNLPSGHPYKNAAPDVFIDMGGEVGWWCPSLDNAGNGTTVLNDLMGANNGTLTNMDPSTDWVSDTANGGTRALDFDGVNDYLTVTDAASLDVTGAITLCAWIKSDGNYGTNGKGIISKYETATNQRSYALLLTSSGNVQFAVTPDGTSASVRAEWGSTVVGTNWRHVAATYVPSTGTVAIYVDGVAESRSNNGGPLPSSIHGGSAPLWVGVVSTLGSNLFFGGRIDDARVFNRALTQTEITALASQRGYQRPTVNGIGGEALWICPSLDTFGNGTLLARDLSNQRNHGTLTNMDVGDWVANTANGGVRAIDFDYVTGSLRQSINLPSAVSLRNQGLVSISLWCLLQTAPATNAAMYYEPTDSDGFTKLGIFQSTTNQILFVCRDTTNGTAYVITATPSGGSWVHVVGTYNANTDRMELFFNGTSVGTNLTAKNVLSDSAPASAMTIGAFTQNSVTTQYSCNALIDDVRQFRRVLSSSEITALASQRGYNLPSNTRRRRYAGAYGL